jgi:hypothetical protein
MKLYVDLGNVLSGLPGPANAFYTFAETSIEPFFLGPNLADVEADVQAGLYADATLDLGLPLGQHAGIGVQGSASTSADAIYGYEQTFGGANESASVRGLAATVTADLSAQAGFTSPAGSAPNKLAYSLFSVGLAAEQTVKDWTQQGQSAPYRSETTQQVSLQAGSQIPVVAWQQYDSGSLFGNYERDFTETVQVTNGNPLAAYSWSVYAGQQKFGINPDLDLGMFGVNLQGELDQGAEVVNERGVFWRARYWPTESYPAITSSLFPTEPWASLLRQWGVNAAGLIGQAVQAVATTVENAANTVVQVGEAGYHGVLNIASGAMAEGSQIYASVSSGFSSLFGGPHPLRLVPPQAGGPRANVDYLPPDGASNYLYGIGGVYRFASSNAFNGTATLTISYGDADVAGLNPADLRIYQLPDGTNRWQLIGGTVDAVSNTVSVAITNLGTYAVAPPLPTGELQLVLSTNALPADGASQLTVVVTNLMLNTGNVATQQWLFTASADGAQILNQDCDTNMPGVQVVSTNGAVTLLLQAPLGGTVAHVTLSSAAGDAYGSAEINLIDSTPPAAPTNVVVTAGQSRIWVSWSANAEADLAGYRVYYRLGAPGPPWDGSATVEGTPSPVMVTGTNCLLRGLGLGTNYFVAVSAVDTTGNESPLSSPEEVTTSQVAPAPPTSVAVRFGQDGTNILMWALSEDDGYNDRDVAGYEVWRAVLPGGSYVKAGEVAAGVGVFTDTNIVVAPGQYVSYAVTAVAGSGASSSPALALILIAAPALTEPAVLADGSVQFNLSGIAGLSYTVQASTNLVDWVPILSLVSTNGTITVVDPAAAALNRRFYRALSP